MSGRTQWIAMVLLFADTPRARARSSDQADQGRQIVWALTSADPCSLARRRGTGDPTSRGWLISASSPEGPGFNCIYREVSALCGEIKICEERAPNRRSTAA